MATCLSLTSCWYLQDPIPAFPHQPLDDMASHSLFHGGCGGLTTPIQEVLHCAPGWGMNGVFIAPLAL